MKGGGATSDRISGTPSRGYTRSNGRTAHKVTATGTEVKDRANPRSHSPQQPLLPARRRRSLKLFGHAGTYARGAPTCVASYTRLYST